MLKAEEQLERICSSVGQAVDCNVYFNNQLIAPQGQVITDALVLRLSQLDVRQLRFSRDEVQLPDDEQLNEFIQQELTPRAADLAVEAGVAEDLTEEARLMATRKVKEIFESCRYLTKIDMTAISELATSLIKRVTSFSNTAFKLRDLRHYDEYTYFHSVNVCVLGTTLFRDLVTNEQDLMDLGVGLLLHDIGKSKIDLKILNKPGRLNEDEFAVITRHTVYGYNLVKAHTEISSLAKDLVLNHHERVNGSGYTRSLTEAQLSIFDMITAICDVFDAVTTNRVYRAKMDVHRAVSILIRGSGIHYQTRLVNHFLRGIGRFPVGTFVLLSTGEIGVVSRVNTNALSLPVIRVIFSSKGQRLTQPLTVDLYQQREIYIDRPLDLTYSPAQHQMIDANAPV